MSLIIMFDGYFIINLCNQSIYDDITALFLI